MSETMIFIGAGIVFALFIGIFLTTTIIMRRRHPVDPGAVLPGQHGGSGLEDAHSWHTRQHD